jgi:oxygen-independent coproporphyrinogen III oxidase
MVAQSAPAKTDSIHDLLQTISLYLHIPFCHAKCHYCDFNSYAGMLGLREAYVEALRREIILAGERARLDDGTPRRCRTIFFGGGTPSLLGADQVRMLLDTTAEAFRLDADAEITLEANPGTLEYGHLGELRAVGVNRLSMGAQSFDAGLLKWMGRIHTPEEIEIAFAAAREAGFTSVNLDFIFGLPDQSMAQWEATLDRAIGLRPEHLSLYSLIVEEGTPLFTWVNQGKVIPADDDLAADMYELAIAKLGQAGYGQYEISNWSLPGHECQHNLTYWHNLPYIGLGAGAHSFFDGHRFAESRPIREYNTRVSTTTNTPLPAKSTLPVLTMPPMQTPLGVSGRLLPAAAIVMDETISGELERGETAMVGMRLNAGVDLGTYEQRFGCSLLEEFGERLQDAFAAGLLEVGDGALRLTARGRLLGNEVFEQFLPDVPEASDVESA